MTEPSLGQSDRTLLVQTSAAALSLALLAGNGRGGPGLTFAIVALTAADLATDAAVRVVATASGGALLAMAISPAGDLPSGLLAVIALVILAGAWPRVGTALGRITAVVLLAGAVLGVYLTVPDTEEIAAVALVVVPALALLAWRPVAAHAPPVTALLALVVWAAAQGGRGRPGAVVGALACLVLVAAPLAARRATRSLPALALVVAVQAAAVLGTARIAGLETSALTAMLIAAPIALGAVIADALVLRVAPAVDPDEPERVD